MFFTKKSIYIRFILQLIKELQDYYNFQKNFFFFLNYLDLL